MDDNKVDIQVIQIDNPWKFLAREKPECARSPQALSFREIFQEMNIYCQRLTDEGMGCYRPNVGEICAASSREDGLWHRVRIESVIPQSHGKQVSCYMIDKGIQLTVPLSRLVKLAKYFQEVPAQVYQCRLCGVQPISLEIVQTDTGLQVVDRPCNKWDPAAVDFMQRMVDESEGCQAEIVHRDSENTHHLRLYIPTRKGSVCFNQVLVDENYATKMTMPDLRFESLPDSCSNNVLNNSLTSLVSHSSGHWSKPQPIDMPHLISQHLAHESHKQSFPGKNNSCDSERASQNKRCAMDKQEMSAAYSQLSDDCSYPIREETESRMKITATKSQSAVLNPETDLLSTVKTHGSGDQQCDEDSCQKSSSDSRTQPVSHQTSLLMSSKLSQISTGSPQNMINIGLGRGRSFILPQNGYLNPQGCLSGSLQKECPRSSISTKLQTCADDFQMPPLAPDIHHTAKDLELSRRTDAVHMPSLTPDIHPTSDLGLSQRMDVVQMPALVSDIHNTADLGLSQRMDVVQMPALVSDTHNTAGNLVLSRCTDAVQMPPLTSDIHHTAGNLGLSRCTDTVQMPPLISDIHHSARDLGLSQRTDTVQMPPLISDIHHSARDVGLSQRTDTVQMPPLTSDILHTARDVGRSPCTATTNPLNDSLALDSAVVTKQQQQKVYRASTTTSPRNSHTHVSPRDGCHLLSSGSLDRQLGGVVQDVRIIPSKPNIPLLTRQDKPVPRPIFGVVVHGKAAPSPICDVIDVPFREPVKTALEEMDIDSAKSIQAFVWPAVLSGRHIVGVCPPGLGKTMSYVPAIVSLLLDKVTYMELPPGKGPIALVIVPSWKNARNVYEMVESLNSPANPSQKIKAHVLYAGGIEDSQRSQFSLLQGCDILISTPHSLLRMLDQETTSLKRMCHIILDDADILARRFPKEVETVMQQYMIHLKDRRVQKKCLDLPKQVLMFASCWTKGVEDFYLRYTKEAIIAISSRVEASVYGGVRQVVKLTKVEQRLATFCNLLGSLSATKHRVVVFTQEVGEAEQLCQAAKSRSVYCLLIHEDLPSQAIEEARTQWIHSSQSRQLMVMVCTDQCYQDLAITNATMVVHYGLPDSKTKFGNRLACMLDYFLDRTSSTKPEVEPVSQVILTNKCVERAQSLYELLQRCQAEYSPQLEQYLAGYRMAIENSERKVLCPFLKSFGVCNVQNKCNHRHLMIPGQDLKTGDTTRSTLPTSGEVKIKIIYVENASQYYCHLLEHRSVPDNVRTDLRLQYQRLVMEMVTFFSKESNHVPYIPSEDPFLDGVCAFRDSDGICHRAKVLTVSEKSIAATAEYRLWLVDAGHHKTASVGQLLKLPQNLAQIPYQAVEAYLCSVKPMDDDVEWTVEANMFINNLVQGKELVGRIMLSVGLTVWLLPLVHQVTLKSVGVANDINVRQELLENKFAAVNPEHIQNLFELFRGKIEISEKLMRQYFDYALQMEMRQESLAEGDRFHEVSIAAVISPDLFYVHKWENFELLEALETRIAEVVKQEKESSDLGQHKLDVDMQLEKGSVCLALSTDNRWYRAQIVTELISGKWLVFFLDYGDKEKILKSSVRPLPRELAELPCQAIECQLAYIQPPGSRWDRLAADAICDLAYFANEEKKKLFAKVVSKVDACYGIGQKLVVDLSDSDVSFSQEVAWRCKARCTGEETAIKDLVGKPALKNQLFFHAWDKIPFLCANIYWSEDHSDAVKQASELQDILSCRDEGWDSDLLQRETLSSAFKIVGYIQDSEAHGILIDSLVTCCLDSDRVAHVAVSEDFLSSLAACLEQASRPSVQQQAATAVARLVSQESLQKSLTNCSYIVSVLTQFLCRPLNSSTELETLKSVCSAASKLVQMTDESVCADLASSVMVEQLFSSLKQTSVDMEREPWLEMLAAVATWDSCHSCLMREAHVADIINLLIQCSCEKCLFYLMSVCRCLVTSSCKHKVTLLENKLLIILKDLEAGGLSSPTSELCRQLMEELSLTLPKPECLAGVQAYQPTKVCQTVSPVVTWSQNCFRILLTIQISDARVEDFSISDSGISCRSESGGVRSQFDWELYDSVIPESSKVCVYASYSLVSLCKHSKGKWSRLLKQKARLLNLRPDFEHPDNSDEEEDVEDEHNITRLTQKKNLLCQKEMWEVKTLKTFESSDEESSDELAWNSHSSDDEPAVDIGSIISSAAMYSSQM